MFNDGPFQIGEHVQVGEQHAAFTIDAHLGSGTQGHVYRVSDGQQYLAMKWYRDDFATEKQCDLISTLIGRGAPSSEFLWPQAFVVAAARTGFGYTMPLRPSGFHSITNLLAGMLTTTFGALIKACLNMCNGFRLLHSRGDYYSDISSNNVFCDFQSGRVLICDNDNVCINGSGQSSIVGTSSFMAPEVIRGDHAPDSNSDLHSLAVLIHEILMLNHPIHGQREANIGCMDELAMRHLYGNEPVYIYDPNDASNRPVPGIHDNAILYWSIYPTALREIFVRAFTDGIRNPTTGRVREIEWCRPLQDSLDAITQCPHCGAENFYDQAKLVGSRSDIGECWGCKKSIPVPRRMRLGKRIVVLDEGVVLYPASLDHGFFTGFDSPVAEVVKHPTDQKKVGLRNLTPNEWTARYPSNQKVLRVAQGQAVTIMDGMSIDFGRATGTVRET